MRPATHLAMRLAVPCALLALPMTAIGQQTPPPLILRDVHVFDVGRARFSEPTDVVIRGGIITNIGAAEPSNAATRIDGHGGYLLPGLWDSHVHLAFATLMGADSVADLLKRFVEHGVLYVRDVGGPTSVLSRMRAEVQSGKLLGPEMFFSGPMAEHSPLHWEPRNRILPGFTVPVDRAEQVDSLVASVAAAGGSSLKAFGNWDLQLLRRLVAEGKRQGLRVILDPGFALYQDVPVDTALALGVASIEHSTSPWQAALRKPLRDSLTSLMTTYKPGDPARVSFAQQLIALGSGSLDLGILRTLADRMKQQGVMFTPTLRVLQSFESDPPPFITAVPAANRAQYVAGLSEGMKTIARVLASAGVTLLVGQDEILATGAADEMSALAAIGIPPATILQAATINAATWLGHANQLGSIERGKRADLVLLEQNPLESIEAVRAPRIVIKAGAVVFQRQ